jgi:hypothetical protein
LIRAAGLAKAIGVAHAPLPGQRGLMRKTETFRSEQDAKAFAKAKLADGSNINAGTLNPHLPKRMISSKQVLDWLDEPEVDDQAEGTDTND